MSRLAPLRKSELAGEQAELYEALITKSVGRAESKVLDETGAVKGPLAVLLRHPATGRPLQELAATLRFAGELPSAAREAAILVVAAHWDDEFEWSRHEPLGRDAGITDAQLGAIRSHTPAAFDDPVVQAAHDAAYGIVTREDLDDEEFVRVREALGDERLVELTVLVGYYTLLSMQLRVFRVPNGGA